MVPVMAAWIWTRDSSSGVSDQQTVGSSRGFTCVLEAVSPVCCVMHVKEPSALTVKRRSSLRCSRFDRQHIASQHLVLVASRGTRCRSRSSRSLRASMATKGLYQTWWMNRSHTSIMYWLTFLGFIWLEFFYTLLSASNTDMILFLV